ncbi:hypothetical protein GCM10027343_02620 [Noviherbaspirillum agri]
MHTNKTLRVLFVEDSEDDMELLLNTLGGEFADIVHERVETGATLRHALLQQWWDVIICDHTLPSLDAPSALRIAQENGSDTPFIVVSGSITDDMAVAMMMAGAADMIGKDHLNRLVPAVRRELLKSSTISNLREEREHLRQMAYTDALTGLPNREFLAERMLQLTAAPDAAETLVLMVVNISRFSLVTRTLGMEAAEQALRLVGERLSSSVGAHGLVASLGGDRFAVLLADIRTGAEPADVIERMNEEVARPLPIAGHELFLTHRIGLSVYPRDGRDFHRLVVNAEIAMSHVPAGGACNHHFFAPGMSEDGQDRLRLEHALHRALKQDEFVLHYQPQYDARNGRLVGVEALLRWQPPGGAPVSPGAFIPVLEETGLIVPVGEWVLRTACLQNLQWQQAGHAPIRVAVNLSAVQFRQAELVPMVRRVLVETGLDPRFLELEITENIALNNEEAVIGTLSELRGLGISLAIDDFGTGYSSLSYLRHFPVNKLKIDRSFVKDITEQEPDSPIVKAIVSLAHNLGLDVIGEGVETPRQEAFLRACGCMEMQGFLFSVPLPARQVENLLQKAEGNVTV